MNLTSCGGRWSRWNPERGRFGETIVTVTKQELGILKREIAFLEKVRARTLASRQA